MDDAIRNIVVNLGGELFSGEKVLSDAKVSVFDRGFLYGDSLYEVLRTYQGQPFALHAHLERLAASAKLCSMTLGQSLDSYAQEIEKTLHAFQKIPSNRGSEVYLRIIVTRGTGVIGFGLNCLRTPTQFIVIAQPLKEPTPEEIQKGMRLKVSERKRNPREALDPAMKSGNYLNSLLAYLEMNQTNTSTPFDDALLLNFDGHLTEGTTFNIGYIRRGIVAVPPLDIGILDGLTRRYLFEILKEEGIPYREVRFPKERLYEADEVFVTSTIREVFPVTQVDQKKIGTGKPGKLTLRLREKFRAYATARLS